MSLLVSFKPEYERMEPEAVTDPGTWTEYKFGGDRTSPPQVRRGDLLNSVNQESKIAQSVLGKQFL
jgi:hypothetical protein